MSAPGPPGDKEEHCGGDACKGVWGEDKVEERPLELCVDEDEPAGSEGNEGVPVVVPVDLPEGIVGGRVGDLVCGLGRAVAGAESGGVDGDGGELLGNGVPCDGLCHLDPGAAVKVDGGVDCVQEGTQLARLEKGAVVVSAAQDACVPKVALRPKRAPVPRRVVVPRTHSGPRTEDKGERPQRELEVLPVPLDKRRRSRSLGRSLPCRHKHPKHIPVPRVNPMQNRVPVHRRTRDKRVLTPEMVSLLRLRLLPCALEVYDV